MNTNKVPELCSFEPFEGVFGASDNFSISSEIRVGYEKVLSTNSYSVVPDFKVIEKKRIAWTRNL